MWTAATLALSILRSVLALFRSRRDQALLELALRQQLEVYARRAIHVATDLLVFAFLALLNPVTVSIAMASTSPYQPPRAALVMPGDAAFSDVPIGGVIP